MRSSHRFPIGYLPILLISSSFLLSFTPSDWHDSLLSIADRQLEQKDAEKGPGLHSAIGEEPYWESFNQWLCFSTQFAKAECTELDGGQSRVPTLRIAVNGALYDYERQHSIQLYEFDMEEEPKLGCFEMVKKWNLLLAGESSVCVYAAHLQDLPISHFVAEKVDQWSLWYISQIKTSKGYWKEYEPKPDEDISDESSDESGEHQEIKRNL